jgi:hypothetical protein
MRLQGMLSQDMHDKINAATHELMTLNKSGIGFVLLAFRLNEKTGELGECGVKSNIVDTNEIVRMLKEVIDMYEHSK